MDVPSVSLKNAAAKFRRAQAARLRQQHKLMRHAYDCQRNKLPQPCRVPGCYKLRDIVNHMATCPSDKKCSWQSSCSSLRQTMRRHSQCTKEYCPVCTQKKEWQFALSEAQRSSLIDLLLETATSSEYTFFGRTLFPHDTEYNVSYTRIMERYNYGTAANLNDYYRTLAADKLKIERDIEEQRRKNAANNLVLE